MFEIILLLSYTTCFMGRKWCNSLKSLETKHPLNKNISLVITIQILASFVQGTKSEQI